MVNMKIILFNNLGFMYYAGDYPDVLPKFTIRAPVPGLYNFNEYSLKPDDVVSFEQTFVLCDRDDNFLYYGEELAQPPRHVKDFAALLAGPDVSRLRSVDDIWKIVYGNFKGEVNVSGFYSNYLDDEEIAYLLARSLTEGLSSTILHRIKEIRNSKE